MPFASRIRGQNSPSIEEARRTLQKNLGHGGLQRIQDRLSDFIPDGSVSEQHEGRHRLSADVFVEQIRENPRRIAAKVLNDVFGPLGYAFYECGDRPAAQGVNEALMRLVAEIGDVARVAEGGVQPEEIAEFSKELAEAEAALARVRASVLG